MGATTATGWVINDHMPFVALPSTKALYRFVRVTNPFNQQSCLAVVLDVGPWNINDDAYVFQGARPQAESGTTNKAGIDLGEAVWNALGMKDNTCVDWEFAT
jgi:hypothetical protein